MVKVAVETLLLSGVSNWVDLVGISLNKLGWSLVDFWQFIPLSSKTLNNISVVVAIFELTLTWWSDRVWHGWSLDAGLTLQSQSLLPGLRTAGLR